jgi:hypothetical protein
MQGTSNIHNKAAVCRLIDILALNLQKIFLQERAFFMIIRLFEISFPEDLSPPVIHNLSRSFLQSVRNHLPTVEVYPGVSAAIYQR